MIVVFGKNNNGAAFWKRAHAEEEAEQMVTGLVHIDGCESVVMAEPRYPTGTRYFLYECKGIGADRGIHVSEIKESHPLVQEMFAYEDRPMSKDACKVAMEVQHSENYFNREC